MQTGLEIFVGGSSKMCPFLKQPFRGPSLSPDLVLPDPFGRLGVTPSSPWFAIICVGSDKTSDSFQTVSVHPQEFDYSHVEIPNPDGVIGTHESVTFVL